MPTQDAHENGQVDDMGEDVKEEFQDVKEELQYGKFEVQDVKAERQEIKEKPFQHEMAKQKKTRRNPRSRSPYNQAVRRHSRDTATAEEDSQHHTAWDSPERNPTKVHRRRVQAWTPHAAGSMGQAAAEDLRHHPPDALTSGDGEPGQHAGQDGKVRQAGVPDECASLRMDAHRRPPKRKQ